VDSASFNGFNAFQLPRDFDFASLTGDVSVAAYVGDHAVWNLVKLKLRLGV
jgi:hypothetical protein